ncbi:ARC1 [Ecytonucleospora hepatopenaei]|uniref:ARC1 n=1 Tax=Ecytonucleospora hepatopenaei TaxID=646526 RepID=A0A1W0E674_9MICR|nr:ARC1 [Ecytonucleospora hepatopenaei]
MIEITLNFKQSDEIFKFILNHAQNEGLCSLETILGTETFVVVNNVKYIGDEMIQEIINMFNSMLKVKEFKNLLNTVSGKPKLDSLTNTILFYNTLKDAIESGSLKNYNFLVEEGKKYKDIDVDFYLLEIKAGFIKEISHIEGTEKMYMETVDFGDEERVICSGLKNKYKEEDLKNKTSLFMTNLKEANFSGVKSFGMICCGSEDENVEFVAVDQAYKGERVSLEGYKTFFSNIKRGEINILKKEKYQLILKEFCIKNGFLFFKSHKVLIGGNEIKLNKVKNGKIQ